MNLSGHLINYETPSKNLTEEEIVIEDSESEDINHPADPSLFNSNAKLLLASPTEKGLLTITNYEPET